MILQGNLREPVRRDSACASSLRHAAIDKQITLVLKIVKLLRNLAERAIPNQSVSSAKAIPCPSGADAVPTASRTPAVCACCRCSATAFITIKDGVLGPPQQGTPPYQCRCRTPSRCGEAVERGAEAIRGGVRWRTRREPAQRVACPRVEQNPASARSGWPQTVSHHTRRCLTQSRRATPGRLEPPRICAPLRAPGRSTQQVPVGEPKSWPLYIFLCCSFASSCNFSPPL